MVQHLRVLEVLDKVLQALEAGIGEVADLHHGWVTF